MQLIAQYYNKIGVDIMPWCPQCKSEYQEGFTECADCKVTLVDTLETTKEVVFESFLQAEDKILVEKLADFFEYSGIPSKMSFDDENELYVLSIPPGFYKEARKYYEAFYYVESTRNVEQTINTDSYEEAAYEATEEESDSYEDFEDDTDQIVTDPDPDAYEENTDSDPSEALNEEDDSTIYVMKSDEYKDLTGTVLIFLIFGIAGLVFVMLNIFQVITILNGWFPNTVMGAVFLLFIIIGFNTRKQASKVKSQIDEENRLTRNIDDWLKENVTESFLASIQDDSISEEVNYIRAVDKIREMIIKEFGSINTAYLDQLIDEYYSKNFDSAE